MALISKKQGAAFEKVQSVFILSLSVIIFLNNRDLKFQYYYSFPVLGVFQRHINDLNVIKCFRTFFHMKSNFSGVDISL